MASQRERVEALIILSSSAEEADRQVVEFLGNVSVEEKIAFLRGMFDVEVLSRTGYTEDHEADYYAMLTGILTAAGI